MMSELGKYKRALQVLKNLDQLPSEKQKILLIAWTQILNRDNQTQPDAQQVFDTAVDKGWLEVRGQDAQGKTVYRVTPAGEEYIDEIVRRDLAGEDE